MCGHARRSKQQYKPLDIISKRTTVLKSRKELAQEIEVRVCDVVIRHICVSSVPPALAPAVSHDEDLLPVIVAHKKHGLTGFEREMEERFPLADHG